MPEVQPYDVPYPNAVVGWTGAIWHCLSVDGEGRLEVRGEDQHFSFRERLASVRTAVISGAGGYLDSNAVTAGRIWKVTNIHAVDVVTATTMHTYMVQRGANFWYFYEPRAALVAGVPSFYHGELWLEPIDTVRVWFTGGLVGDTCIVTLTGYEMTKEV